MAEPASSTTVAAVTATGVTLVSFFHGIDANALIGATAGSSLFVMSAKDLKIITRLVYLLISLFMGYTSGEAVLGHIFSERAISSFVFSACVIGLGLKLINSVDQIDINNWFRPK
ncbi:putative holin [Cellvibrio mixtus]|uniref:putative holin n=1 Tax=Cellvibrio mixtus TaxID=39650 RepID=UPI0005879483|nr:putative holin [Cellvibrio mixtus]